MPQRLTVVIPVFNDGRYLPATLGSVARQTRLPDELLLIDDGSTDPATLALLAQLENQGFAAALRSPRARAVALRLLRQENRGVAQARNRAVLEAKGELILPLDADDQLLPRGLELLEQALQRDPGAAFASGQVAYFGTVRGSATPPRFNPYLELDENPQLPLALFRAEVFRERGLRYAGLRAFEDWGLWLAVAAAGLRSANVEEVVYRYRRKGKEGLLAWGEERRPALEAALRDLFPQLYSPEGRARLKERHAPALEILWGGDAGDAGLRAFLAAQSLDDVSVSARPEAARSDSGARPGPGSVRALLHEARGKFLLRLSPPSLPLLAQARLSFLEQAVRALEAHDGHDALLVPADRETLEAAVLQPRLVVAPAERPSSHSGDLIFFRTARAKELRTAHFPPGASEGELHLPALRRGRALLFQEDFFHLVREVPKVPPKGVTPIPPPEALWKRSVDQLAPLYRRARRGAARAIGRERLGRLLHPLRLRLLEARWGADAVETALREKRNPLKLEPLLPASVRAEKERLDQLPVRFERIEPLPVPFERIEPLPAASSLAPPGATLSPAAPPAPILPGGAPRVLLCMPWIVHGGVDRALLELASTLSGAGHRLFAATSLVARHDWEHRLLPLVDDLVMLGEVARPEQQQDALVDLVRERRIDALFLVHSWLGLESLPALKARFPRLRTVDFQHMDYQTPGGNFARVSSERYDRFLDLRLVSTEYLRRRYREAYGVDPGKVRLIRAGCDEEGAFNPARVPQGQLRARLGISGRARVVGFLARFVPEKDPLFVVRVFAALDRAATALGRAATGGEPLQFVLIGEGPLRPPAEALAQELGLGERAHFLPSDTEVPAALRDLSILLMASREEGLPLSFYEALALETPVVSTGLEGIPELIDSEVGACVPDSADPEERLRRLARAALPLLTNEPFRQRIGQAGRLRIQASFSAAQTRSASLEAFAELLRGGAA